MVLGPIEETLLMGKPTTNPATLPCTGARPRVKIWLEKEERYVFGHGIAEILTAVNDTGSIKEAARRVGKSYRYVWGRIKEAEDAFEVQLVETRVGGGDTARSTVTPFAAQLLNCFNRLRADLVAFAESRYAECCKDLDALSDVAHK